MRTAALSVLLLGMCVLAPAHAKIYKWVMPDGTIEYSDRPQQEGAKPMELPPLPTYSPPPAPPEQPVRPAGNEEVAEGYDQFQVVAPTPDEVIRDDGNGTVSVQLELEPGLRGGHTVEILLDGKPIGSGRATSVSVSNVNRGTHTVSAVVKDGSGKTVATAPGVTFHLKKVSTLLPARPVQPLPPPARPINPVPTPLPRSSGGRS